MKIGEQLQSQRKLHHMSQNELAEKLHLTRQSISKWENGTTLPSFANVITISELFDVSLDELIKGDAALMDKFKDDGKIRLTKIETIIIVGFLLVAISLGIIYATGISLSNVNDWLPDFALVFFILFMMSVDRKKFNDSLNKKAVIFGILLLVTIMVPFIMQFLSDVLKGMIEQQVYYDHLYK
ncbi:helix-turn-helix transcriptional regulator [Companilactobacillus musae]|uniref:helix-turn-helix domain-containing protein n=1 Tax=Companilactobacillus musae TaxID=1903258 RepID=UPI000E64665C|nr:helix-turn-helix transcriptional regulator [Companilactobacillus musae]